MGLENIPGEVKKRAHIDRKIIAVQKHRTSQVVEPVCNAGREMAQKNTIYFGLGLVKTKQYALLFYS